VSAGGLDRRAFLEGGVRAAVLAALASACGSLDLTAPTLDKEIVVKLADYPALAQVGGVARIDGANIPLAVARLKDADFAALSLVCPHAGTTVAWQDAADMFVCPLHGARFAIDGQWIGGQPTSGLVDYPTTYDAGAGTLRITPR